jgi:APA family basic amino acid/polyamine antiporter
VTDASSSARLGLGAATALVISHTIAVGIFLTPAELIGALASPALTLLIWVGCAALILAGAFTFGELASRYPRAGGLYVYLREAWGPRVAFLYGWQSLLIMDPGVTAALAAGASQYVGLIWPGAADHQRLVAAGLIWILAVLNMAGLTFGARVFGVMTILKLCTLSGIVILAFASGAGSWSHFASPASRPVAALPWASSACSSRSGVSGRRAASRAKCAIRGGRCRAHSCWAC